MKSQLSTKELVKVKKSLPNNGMESIAIRLGLSLTTVSRVLGGKNKRSQTEVVKCALEIIQEEKTKFEQLQEEINSL